MDQEVEKYKESNYRNAESVNNIKKLKFEVYNEIFSCIEKIKSKYQNSAKEALISEICEKIVKSDFSSFFAISSEINPKNKGSLFEKEYMKRLKHIKLYHYTSMESLYSITKSNSILLSNIQDMNDFSECKLFFDILIKNLRKKSICSDETINYVTDLFIIKLNDVFTFSFSTEDDDAAQWQRYADNGKGVCLVCDLLDLYNFFFHKSIGGFISPVEYVDKNTKLDSITNRSIDDYEIIFKVLSNIQSQTTNILSNDHLIKLILDCSRIKDRSFRNENECRLIVCENSNQCDDNSKISVFDKDKFIKTKYELKGAFCKKSDNKTTNYHFLFSKIVLGPKSEADPYLLQQFLSKERGLLMDVSKSRSTLR